VSDQLFNRNGPIFLTNVGRMRPVIVASLLLVAFVAVSLSGCKPAHDNSDVEQAVMDAQRRWEKAFKQFDPESIQSLLAEDDLQTDFRGVFQDKAGWLQDFKHVAARVRSGVTKWESSFDDEKVRTYGNAAVVTGRLTGKGVVRGAPVNHVVRFTTVWVKRKGAWQLVSWQATPIEPQ
jgi:ketosteroid isomerase-like protein